MCYFNDVHRLLKMFDVFFSKTPKRWGLFFNQIGCFGVRRLTWYSQPATKYQKTENRSQKADISASNRPTQCALPYAHILATRNQIPDVREQKSEDRYYDFNSSQSSFLSPDSLSEFRIPTSDFQSARNPHLATRNPQLATRNSQPIPYFFVERLHT